ncbi:MULTISPECIES: hypothetical protein [unclassified Providencia]|uniref:hypothetical protein n=1 Tax=unclassified Providencia TaxID=2633465 RepID=UPI00234B5DCC|nr:MULTISPECIES: hypothetical protein [unclassified Providencia]
MKEEAKEIVQAVSETIKERASNPIIVTFIISWCVYNWNALLLLVFSKEAIVKRIDIASLQFIETESWLFPIIFTVGYCLLSKPLNAGLRKLMEKIDHFVISLEYSREMTKQKHEEQLEILKAKAEMAYDSTKTDEKNKIQKINEEITESKKREGLLTQEVDELKKSKLKLETSETELKENKNKLEIQVSQLSSNELILQDKIIKYQNDNLKLTEELQRSNSFNEVITQDHSKLTDENKNVTSENVALLIEIKVLRERLKSLEENLANKNENYSSIQTFRAEGLGGLSGIGEVDKEINKKTSTITLSPRRSKNNNSNH